MANQTVPAFAALLGGGGSERGSLQRCVLGGVLIATFLLAVQSALGQQYAAVGIDQRHRHDQNDGKRRRVSSGSCH